MLEDENGRIVALMGFITGVLFVIFHKYIAQEMNKSQKKVWGSILEKLFGKKAVDFIYGPGSIKIGNYIILIIGIILYGSLRKNYYKINNGCILWI